MIISFLDHWWNAMDYADFPELELPDEQKVIEPFTIRRESKKHFIYLPKNLV